VAKVRAALEGTRNEQLNKSAFALGTLIGGGELDQATAETELLAAALGAGLSSAEAVKTIASGMQAGIKKPRRIDPPAVPTQPTSKKTGTTHEQTPHIYIHERPHVLPEGFVLECLHEEEYGDARLFARLYQGRLLYDHSIKTWFVWGGHAWYPDKTNLIRQLVAGQLARQYLHLAADLSPETKTQKLVDHLTSRTYALRRLNRCNNVIQFATSMLGITGDEWDTDPWLLGVQNGVIDLRSGKMRAGRPEDYIRTICPTTWKGIDAPAPRFEQFIRDIFNEQDDIAAFVQRLLGYSITGLTVEHIFPVLWGEKGRNGKDTLLETIKRVLGDLADTVSTDVLLATNTRGGAQPHLCDLQGKRLVWASETDLNARLNAAQIKLITGGGTIKTRPLYGNMIEFQPSHLVLLITNFKPKANADDDALWNRMVLLPFTLRFVAEPGAPDERQRDPHLIDKLATERSGILAWLVRGCLAWQRTGLAIPDGVKASTEAYREEEDIIGQFVDECCVIHSHASVTASALYNAYREWSDNAGMTPLNQINFGKRMGKRFERKRLESRFQYLGVGLCHPDPSDPSDPLHAKFFHESEKSLKSFAQKDQEGSGSEMVVQDMPSQRDISQPPANTKGSGKDQPPPGQGEEQGAAGRAIPLQGASKPNINDERRDLVTQARALLKDVGTASELATVDVSGRSVQELRRLIGQLEQRRTS
jgi:putative DNA primase/helicase